MNNIATKFSSSSDVKCFNEFPRNLKKIAYLGIIEMFLNSNFVILGIAEKNMETRGVFYLEGTKPKK